MFCTTCHRSVECLFTQRWIIFPFLIFSLSYNQNITFDASFIKLRELSFSYSLPDMKGIKNASVSVYTGNLMIWTAAKIGIDPERAFQANGGNQGNTQSQFKQGYESHNVMAWSATGGVKLNFSF